MTDWRVPNEEEKKYIASWIKKHVLSLYWTSLVFIGIFLSACTAIEVVRFFHLKNLFFFESILWIYLIISFTGSLLHLLEWKKTIQLVMDGAVWINDGKLIEKSYFTRLLEVSYFEKDEPKIVRIGRYSGMGSYSNGGENGYIVHFITKDIVARVLMRDYLFVPGRVC